LNTKFVIGGKGFEDISLFYTKLKGLRDQGNEGR
jgi:hypothetical protein